MYPELEGRPMRIRDFWKGLKTPEHRLAWLVAMAADAIQIAVVPMFGEGVFSPADTALDVIVAALLIRLLGWHWAFLPSFAAELMPGFDLFPTWTAAVFFVTRREVMSSEPEILPPGPAPEPRR
jgi:hypothetical protein